MSKRKDMQVATVDRPHKLRIQRGEIVPYRRRETHDRTVEAGYEVAGAEPWAALELTAPQRDAARAIATLWQDAALHQRSITMDLDRVGGGTGEMSDRRARGHARLNRALRKMGAWRSAEVVAFVCYGEAHRDRELVVEGLEIAAREWGL